MLKELVLQKVFFETSKLVMSLAIFFGGRNRIDACSKDIIFARYDIRRHRVNVVVANDNTAPVVMAA